MGLDAIKRKRVGQVGSGAYTIYLPKKWIDDWMPQQLEEREIDLHQIRDSLLLVPVHRDRRFERVVPPERRLVEATLVSAYLQGYNNVRLTPIDGETFGAATVSAARDLLRHLDERLLASGDAQGIGFDLRPELPPPAASGQDLLTFMAVKVTEVLRLAAEAVDRYATDPDGALYALQLLHTTQQEDVSRLVHQATRMVANLELPLGSVTDFQFLDLTASNLYRMGDDAAAVGRIILESYGLTPDHLAYPRQHLLDQIGELEPPRPIVRAFDRLHAKAIERIADLTADLLKGLQRNDLGAVNAALEAAQEAQEDHARRTFATIMEHWGREAPEAASRSGFLAYQLGTPLAALFADLRMMGRQGIELTAAAEGPLGQ
ncbi:MAG: hypothetical protein ACPGQL_09105 [Thermoplasmatota archaeon]